jgi:hypothetical protein
MDWKPKGKDVLHSFKEFNLKGGEVIGVFQGSLGTNPDLDIIVMYKDKYTKSTPRKPKHINWVIDLLIKKEHNKELTLEFVKYLLEVYDKVEPFKTKAEQQRCELRYTNTENLEKFEPLNAYGQYSVELIGHVMELLSMEEKQFAGAFMFKKVLTKLYEDEDIYSISNTALPFKKS